jgi:hypothetical protein
MRLVAADPSAKSRRDESVCYRLVKSVSPYTRLEGGCWTKPANRALRQQLDGGDDGDDGRRRDADRRPAMSRIDAILTFGNLHIRTCGGAQAVTINVEDTTLHQRCTCGAELSVTLDVEETEALTTTVKSKARYDAAMRRLGRRIVQ